MKCNGRKILREQRERAADAEYLLVFLEFIDVELSQSLMQLHGWKRKRLKWLFDTQRYWASDWIKKYAASGGKIKDRHKGYRDLTSEELWRKNIDLAQQITDDDLAALGFAYDFTDMIPANLRHGGWRREQIKGSRRALWYAVYGERMIRLYVTTLLKLLHDERGFGESRLRGLYEPLAECIRWYVERFFVGSERTEKEIKDRLDSGHKRIEELGIELLDIVIKEEPEKKPAKPKEVPAGLENLAWDKIKDQNTFDITRKEIRR